MPCSAAGATADGRLFRELIRELIRSDDPSYSGDELRSTIEAARPDAEVVIVTHEDISTSLDTGRTADRLHDLVPDARILVCVREQRSALAARYGQYVKDGGSRSFSTYLGQRPHTWLRYDLVRGVPVALRRRQGEGHGVRADGPRPDGLPRRAPGVRDRPRRCDAAIRSDAAGEPDAGPADAPFRARRQPPVRDQPGEPAPTAPPARARIPPGEEAHEARSRRVQDDEAPARQARPRPDRPRGPRALRRGQRAPRGAERHRAGRLRLRPEHHRSPCGGLDRRRGLAVVSLLLVVPAVLLAGCSDDDSSQPEPSTTRSAPSTSAPADDVLAVGDEVTAAGTSCAHPRSPRHGRSTPRAGCRTFLEPGGEGTCEIVGTVAAR